MARKAPAELGSKMAVGMLGGSPGASSNSSDFEVFKPEAEESEEITVSRRITDSEPSQETPYSNNITSKKILESLEDLKVLELKEVFEKSKELLKQYKKELGNIR